MSPPATAENLVRQYRQILLWPLQLMPIRGEHTQIQRHWELLEVPSPATVGGVLNAVETKYPVLRGTIRDHGSLKRRPFIRFFACKEDLSNEPLETVLPEAIVSGKEPFLIVGAMAGG